MLQIKESLLNINFLEYLFEQKDYENLIDTLVASSSYFHILHLMQNNILDSWYLFDSIEMRQNFHIVPLDVNRFRLKTWMRNVVEDNFKNEDYMVPYVDFTIHRDGVFVFDFPEKQVIYNRLFLEQIKSTYAGYSLNEQQ